MEAPEKAFDYRLIWDITAPFVGAYVGYLFGRRLNKQSIEANEVAAIKREFSSACEIFASTFDETIYKLTATGDFADVVLFGEMPKHKIASEKFSTVLIKTQKRKTVARFDEIWNEYYCDNPTEKYDTSSMGKDIPKELALERIKSIIDFVNNI